MPEERTESELLFDQYLTERGYVFESQPKIPAGKSKKLDNRIFFEGSEIFFEVKEFSEGDDISSGAFDPYNRIHSKLKKSRSQLNDYKEYSCSVVLYNGSAAPVFLKPEFVLGAMLGTLTYGTNNKGKLTHKFFGEPSGFQTGHMIDFKNKQPRSTQFSSVIVLEKFPIGQIKLSPLLDERKQHRQKKLSAVEGAVDTWDYIQKLESEGFDINETVLRVVVYENPYADIPLPRGLFQGPYDERWGSEKPKKVESLTPLLMKFAGPWLPEWLTSRLSRLYLRFSKGGKIIKILEGTKLRELDAAIQSYSRSPLVETGILKDK
ncbi:MAG: hypothetical protein JST85_15335 [Acidobacteria bacterium]|nr:hypothetical protein [Acidobacteriota bacterium]